VHELDPDARRPRSTHRVDERGGRRRGSDGAARRARQARAHGPLRAEVRGWGFETTRSTRDAGPRGVARLRGEGGGPGEDLEALLLLDPERDAGARAGPTAHGYRPGGHLHLP